MVLPASGGGITATLGVTVSVVFPAGAVTEPVQIFIDPVDDVPETGGFTVLGEVFQITARSLSGPAVTQFPNPFLVQVAYGGLPPARTAPPNLYYWRESEESWEKIPALHNPTARTLTAVLGHLPPLAVMQEARVPIYIPMIWR